MGTPFHLRADDAEWRQGWRLAADLRLVGRGSDTARALQRLEPLLDGVEVLHVAAAAP